MNKDRNKKSLPSLRRIKSKIGAIGILVLVCVMLSAVTMAYVFTQTIPVVNKFTPSKVASTVVESFDGTTKSNVLVKNSGDTEAYIRAAVVITWVNDTTGEVYPIKPVVKKDYNIDFPTEDPSVESHWELAADGFWYYKIPVAPNGGVTTTFIDKCVAVDANTPDGYSLSVEIVSSAIQSTPTTVVAQQWESGVSGVDGTTLEIIAPGSGE
ncbi:MAG: hypothetical protein IKU53_01120 [Firmicutes bacterium]|nr:hypothetical protein [Bacillota bacterium]